VRILSHYFIARFCGLFLTVLVAAVAIVATIELVLNFEEFAALPAGAAAAGPATHLRTLSTTLWTRLATTYLGDLLPVSSFVASFLTFAIAGRRLEWIAIEGSGIRPLRIFVPVLAVAGLLALAAGVLDETTILRARHDRLLETQYDRDEIDLERRAFWYHRGPIITNVGHADPTTRTLHDVELYERGDGDATGRILRIVRAGTVRILADGTWRFEHASVWLFDPRDPLAEPRFESDVALDFDLDSVPRNTLALADPAILPFTALARHLADEDSPAASPERRRLAQVYHERLSRPLWVLAFCWLALPFGMRVDRRGRIAPAAAAALLALATFYAVATAGSTLTRLFGLPAGAMTWATLGLSTGIAALFLALRRRA